MIVIEAGRYGQLPVVAFHQIKSHDHESVGCTNARWRPIMACRNAFRADKGMLMIGLVYVEILLRKIIYGNTIRLFYSTG
jgi:hypothetical protein